ncbi:FAD-binding protein [Escherichia coli]
MIGAGGAAMARGAQISQSGADLGAARLPDPFPYRFCDKGGITVALGIPDEDNGRAHRIDTVKGSDYNATSYAIEDTRKTGPEATWNSNTWACRLASDDGRIYQRPFGGESKNFGGEQADARRRRLPYRSRTVAHALSADPEKPHHHFLRAVRCWICRKPRRRGGGLYRTVHRTGEVVYFKARATVLATGGAGRIYQSTMNAHINTGDGVGMAIRAGVPVQDMEKWRSPPTGIAGAGVLVTERLPW